MKKHYEPETLISLCLRGGVLIAAFTIAAGLVLLGVNGTAASLPTESYTTIGGVISGVLDFNPVAIISLGLLFLILTPLLRVALSILIFLVEKDYFYVGITLFVLIVLILSLVFGEAL